MVYSQVVTVCGHHIVWSWIKFFSTCCMGRLMFVGGDAEINISGSQRELEVRWATDKNANRNYEVRNIFC